MFRFLQGLVAILIAARWLSPPEAAVFGDTLWIVQLWTLAVLLWGWDAFRRSDYRVRLDALDLAVGIVVLGHVVSTIYVLGGDGDQRAALNLMWEWVGLGLSFFIIRQATRTREDSRRLAGILLAASVMLAGYGVWQHYVELPRLVENYEEITQELDRHAADAGSFTRNDTARLRQDLIELGVPANPVSRSLWENRLKSTEPFATFALTNTLAGFLVAWLFAGMDFSGIPMPYSQRSAKFPWAKAGRWGCLVLIAFCLVLTKSRTAWAGFLAGLLVWGGIHARSMTKPLGRWVLAAGGVAILGMGLFAAAALSGGFDREVISEAPKSLAYRLEYWTGSWDVVKHQPWLGTGPGNFRQHYLHDKLPGSSEEIADPHNWILDLWTSGGLLAVLGFLALIVLAVRAGIRLRESNREAEIGTPLPKGISAWEVGAAIAFPLVMLAGWMAGEPFDATPLWLLAGWCLACRLFPGDRSSRWPTAGFFAGGLAILVHLLGAGGIEMPAIAQTLLLLAVFLSWRDWASSERAPTGEPNPKIVLAIAAAGIGAFGLCLFTATMPSWYRKVNLASGDAALGVNQNVLAAERFYRKAAESDPYSAEPVIRLAELAFQRWLATSNERDFQRAVEYGREAIELDPVSNQGYRRLGLWYFERAERRNSSEDAKTAAEYLSEAVARYPSSALLRGEYALALESAGQMQAASEQAERALALDQINRAAGHRDKFLPAPFVEKLKRLRP